MAEYDKYSPIAQTVGPDFERNFWVLNIMNLSREFLINIIVYRFRAII